MLHPPDVNSAKKVTESAGSVVEYEEITDSMILQARQKHPPRQALHPILPAATPALIYATPAKPTENVTIVPMATGDLTPNNAAQQCVPPIVQCHDDSIRLAQNSAYQMAKQHQHAGRSRVSS